VDATHTLVNGQSGTLNALTGKAAYAEGVLAGSHTVASAELGRPDEHGQVQQQPPA
jgi:hypothetical protein